MKELAIAVVATLSAFCTIAAETPKGEDQAKNRSRYMAWLKRTGGRCSGVTRGGSYTFLDCTKSGKADISNAVHRIGSLFDLVVVLDRCELGPEGPLASAREYMRAHSGVRAVTVMYDGLDVDPIESYCPMERVAIVNMARLYSADARVQSDRVLAMANRSVLFVSGGVMQTGFDGVLKNIFDVSGIDRLAVKTAHPVSVQQVHLNAEEIGMAQKMHATYRVACSQGWAPAPTNDIQKSIWVEVHSEIEKGPPNGLRIVPPSPR